MFLKKIKNATFSIVMSILLIMPSAVFAYSEKIIPGGENIGIQINTKGVIVVGLYKVNNSYPGKEADLRVGDVITKINDEKISNINDMISKIESAKDKSNIKITYLRNKETLNTNLKLVKQNDGVYRTGLYVKDSINGIGTLTFIDPKTKNYGALGHEIIEANSGKKLDIKDGKIYKSEITNITKSSDGSPGEKNAKYYPDEVYGSVK